VTRYGIHLTSSLILDIFFIVFFLTIFRFSFAAKWIYDIIIGSLMAIAGVILAQSMRQASGPPSKVD
jgi:uncharacterized membrane protein